MCEFLIDYIFLQRNLRELDRDILRKFIGLNDCIEEVRWRLADNEAKFQRKLAEDDADDDFFSSLTETRLDEWDAPEPDPLPAKDDTIFEKPRTLDTQSYNAISIRNSESSKSSKPVEVKNIASKPVVKSVRTSSASLSTETPTSSLDNPTYSSVDEHRRKESADEEKQPPGKVVQLEKSFENNYYR